MGESRSSRDPFRIVEVVVLITLVSLTYMTYQDPGRLFGWLFGDLHPHTWDALRPWLSLLRGLNNVVLLGLVLSLLGRKRWTDWVRWIAAGWLTISLLVIPVLVQVELRHNVDEAEGNDTMYVSATHDGGVLQVEMASAALLEARNPYTEDYGRPPMSRAGDSNPQFWKALGYESNPAFSHCPYLPGIIYVSAAAMTLCDGLLGFYDQRLLYLIAALALAALIALLCPPGPARRIAWVVTPLFPMLHVYLVFGRTDVLMLAPLAWFALCMKKRQWTGAAIALGIAVSFKQFAVFALPLFFVLLYRRKKDPLSTLRYGWPALAIPAVVVAPLLLWNAGAFIEDVFLFNVGLGSVVYPVRWDGYGITPLAYAFDWIQSPAGANPLAWLSIPAILGALGGLGYWVWRGPSVRRTLLASGILLFVALFTSRFFAPNYIVAPTLMFVLAGLVGRKTESV